MACGQRSSGICLLRLSTSLLLPSPIPRFHPAPISSSMTPGEQHPEDAVSSGCSSGCRSGWTTYLAHSASCAAAAAAPHPPSRFRSQVAGASDDEEEDMSMVSDASSGPPQFHETEEEQEEEEDAPGNCKRRRVEAAHEGTEEEDASILDDTASSHIFTHSISTGSFCGDEDDDAKKVEFSCCFSATHFKRKLRSSVPIKPTPARPVQ